jgi:hypothetical protein
MRAQILFRAIVAAQAMLLAPHMSYAAEWSAEPSIRAASEHDDNIHLTTLPHSSVYALTVAPKLNLVVRSDIWQVNGGAEYEHKNYSGEEGLDTDNRYFRLGSSYKTERSAWQLDSSLARASVTASEMVRTDKYVYGYYYYFPVANSVMTHRMQEAINVGPSWSWSIDERNILSLSYQYGSISYVNGSSAGLNDSNTRSASMKLTNQVSPVDEVFLSGSYSHFRAPSISRPPAIDVYTLVANAVNPTVVSSESKSTSYQTGISRAFSQDMSGNFSFGLRRTEAEQLTRTCPSPNPLYIPPFGSPLFYDPAQEPCTAPYGYRTGFSVLSSAVFSAGLQMKHENSNASFAVSRDFSTSSAGDQVRNDALSFSGSWLISAKLTGNFSGSISESSSETGTVETANSRSYQIRPGMAWQWTEELSVNTYYQRTNIKRSWESESATSNYVYLGLAYQWQKMAISR